MKHIEIINGPNLNLTGKREPAIYGNTTMEEMVDALRQRFPDVEIGYYQSNVEGEIINRLHEVGFSAQGIILNAGGYSHTSVAIHDAIAASGYSHTSVAIHDAVAAITTPVVEVHISNIFAREEYRRHSLLSEVCWGVVCGFGLEGYRFAVESFLKDKHQ